MNIGQWFSQLDFSFLIETGITVVAALVCIIFHECAHGVVAYWLGDDTAKRAGRLSLNPLRHIDWVGLFMMAVAKVGWAKPVPINPSRFKHPKAGMALTAIAGPLCNVLLAFVTMIFFGALAMNRLTWSNDALYYLAVLLMDIAMISCGLAVFNLIPIPPLDGSKVLAMALPMGVYQKWMRYEQYGMLVLIALVLVLPYVTDFSPIGYLRDGLWNLLWRVARYPARAIAGV